MFSRCLPFKSSINQSINQSIRFSINQSFQLNHAVKCSAFHTLKQSINQKPLHKDAVFQKSISRSINQSFNQSNIRSFHQSAVRSILQTPNQSTDESLLSKVSNTWSEWKPRLVTYFYIGTALFVGVLILRGGLYFVNFFTSLDFADVGRWAFVAGMMTSLSLVGVAMIGRRALSLRPEAVYQDALKQVLNDITVRSFLGNSIKTGSFRAYSFVPGTVRLPGTVAAQPDAADEVLSADPTWLDRLTQYWKPRRLQLFFQITGSDGNHAMCSAEVQKVRGSMRYNLLCVDILNTGQRVVLMGSPDYQIYQGIIKLR